QCEQMIFHRDMVAHLYVCQHCNHHLRMPVAARIDHLFDPDTFSPVSLAKTARDPLKFRDLKRYSDRLREAQQKTGRDDAIIVGQGQIGGLTVTAAFLDFEFMGGSMGVAVGSGLIAACQKAAQTNTPLIVFTASGGARMQEGPLSLMQLPRTIAAIEDFKDSGQPYLVVLCDPTMGGVTASFAMLGDLHLAEPNATIGFAGRRVVEETIGEKLPPTFQTSQYLLEHGMIDLVTPRADLPATLARVLRLLVGETKKTPKEKISPAPA
ncbi:MAG: acetyl-CoA carboxylase, carboxyltransferase subunit beta, partial [Pseudomonadota bacterium]